MKSQFRESLTVLWPEYTIAVLVGGISIYVLVATFMGWPL